MGSACVPNRNPFDTITEGIGLNRLTANFDQAAIDGAFKGALASALLALGIWAHVHAGLRLPSASSRVYSTPRVTCRAHWAASWPEEVLSLLT